jgi:hypothetical protein
VLLFVLVACLAGVRPGTAQTSADAQAAGVSDASAREVTGVAVIEIIPVP